MGLAVMHAVAIFVVSLAISVSASAGDSFSRMELYGKRPANGFHMVDGDHSSVCKAYLSAINKERNFVAEKEFSFQDPGPKSEMDLPELVLQTELNAVRRIVPQANLGLGGSSRYEQFEIKLNGRSQPIYPVRATGARGGGWIHYLLLYQDSYLDASEGLTYREFRDDRRSKGLVSTIGVDWARVGSGPLGIAAKEIGFNSIVVGGVVEVIDYERRSYFVRTSAYITDSKPIDIILFEIDKAFSGNPKCLFRSNFTVFS